MKIASLLILDPAKRKIEDEAIRGMMKNQLEFFAFESLPEVPFFVAPTVEEALAKALAEDYDHCFITYPGTRYSRMKWSFNEYLENKPEDEVLCGHVLDRGEKYYELHPQTFYISAKWWDKIGRIPFDRGGRFKKVVNMPIRSEENFHGNYTPKWIKPGGGVETFEEFCWGWNIINAALLHDKGIGIWNEEFRKDKCHTYPEDTDSFVREMQQFVLDEKYYPFNTEVLDADVISKGKGMEHDIVIAPSAGINGMLYAKDLNLKKGGELIIFDCSALGLSMAEKVYTMWDGRNHTDFLANVLQFEAPFIIKTIPYFDGEKFNVQPPGFYPQIDTQEWKDWFDEYFHTFKIRFIRLNMFDFHGVSNLVRGLNPNRKKYFHLSNIFHYQRTAIMFSARVRLEYMRQLQGLFNEYMVDSTIDRDIVNLEEVYDRFQEQTS